jgi:hypothetical protein
MLMAGPTASNENLTPASHWRKLDELSASNGARHQLPTSLNGYALIADHKYCWKAAYSPKTY